MLQLHCLSLAEEEFDSGKHELVLEVAGDPERLLLTLHLCRLLMPPNTAPIHLENWRQTRCWCANSPRSTGKLGYMVPPRAASDTVAVNEGAGAADRA